MSIATNLLAVEAKDNPAQLEALWNAVRRLICLWAYQFARRANAQGTRLFDVDDLTQSGYLALCDAVPTFDPDRASFATHLHYHVRRRFAEVAGARGKVRPETNALSLDESLPAFADDNATTRLDMLEDRGASEAFDDVIEQTHNEQLHAALENCLEKISPNHANLLRERYFEGKTFTQLSEESGTVRQAIWQMEQLALQSLRRSSAASKLKGFREFITARSYKRGSLRMFQESNLSSVEWAYEQMENYYERRNQSPDE